MKISSKIARAAKPRERNIRDALDERVASYGGFTRALTYLGRNGCPDVLVCFPPSLLHQRPIRDSVLVETKTDEGRLSKAQKGEIALLRSAGIQVLVIHTQAQLDAWLPELPF